MRLEGLGGSSSGSASAAQISYFCCCLTIWPLAMTPSLFINSYCLLNLTISSEHGLIFSMGMTGPHVAVTGQKCNRCCCFGLCSSAGCCCQSLWARPRASKTGQTTPCTSSLCSAALSVFVQSVTPAVHLHLRDARYPVLHSLLAESQCFKALLLLRHMNWKSSIIIAAA